MNKIIIALDATNLNTSTIDFACYLGRLTHSTVTGIFLENTLAAEQPAFMPKQQLVSTGYETDNALAREKHKRQQTDSNIAFFKEACERRSVRAHVHRDRGVPAAEIIEESRFADMIVTDATASFSKVPEGMPTSFLKELLNKVECPVIIAPENFDGLEELVLAYDGSAASVFAIKQFSYLLPQLSSIKATVFQVNATGTWASQEKHQFSEWLENHFSRIEFKATKGEADDGLFDYLFRKPNAVLVMGAYGRSAFSRLFQHSTADPLIRVLTCPIFISHQ